MQNDIHSQEDRGEAPDQVKRCPASLRGLEGKLRAAGWWPVGAESAPPLSL